MSRTSENERIADQICASLPGDAKDAAQTALVVAAAKCIDARHSDEEAVHGFRQALASLRKRLKQLRMQ